jgi:hypothetical protein
MRHAVPLTALLFALAACDDGGSTKPGTDPTDAQPGPGADAGPQADAAPRVDPALAITAPLDGAFVRTRRVEVTGTVTGATAVTVNGAAARVTGGDWTITLELEPGEHTLTAAVDGLEVAISITVDPVPPRIDITAPARGTHTEADSVDLAFTITDDYALSEVTRNGLAADSGQAPDFLLQGVRLEHGLNLQRLEARDQAGNLAREHVAVLSGALTPPDMPIASALRVKLGTNALDAVGRLGLRLLAEQDLSGLLGDGEPISAGPFTVGIGDLTYGNAALTLTPEPQVLKVSLVLEQVVVSVSLQSGMREANLINIGAARITVDIDVTARAVDGMLDVQLGDPIIRFEGLELALGDVPGFENDPEGEQSLLETLLGVVAEEAVKRFVPDLVDGLLGALDDPIDLELLGAQLRLVLRPNAVVIAADGIKVRVDAGIELLNPPAEAPALAGYVGTPNTWDGVPETDDVGIAVDDDVLNLLLYQIWRAGVLFPTLDRALVEETGSALRLVTGFLGTLIGRQYPDIGPETPLKVDTELPLPIHVAITKSDGAGLKLGIGDMVLDVRTDDGNDRALLAGSASIIFSGTLNASQNDEGELGLDLNVTGTEAAFDVTTEALRGEVEQSVEQPIIDLVDSLGATLPGLLRGFTLPSFDLFTLGNIRVGTAGPQENFLTVIAEIVE